MYKHLTILAAAFYMGTAFAAPASPLVGVWVEVGGPGMARIAPCAASGETLCATGLSRRSGTLVDTGIVVSGLTAAGSNRWRGTYHDGGRGLPATVRLVNQQRVEMKVCILFVCQTARYDRSETGVR